MKIVITIILAIALTWASINIIRIPWILGDEATFASLSTTIKKALNEKVLHGRFYDSSFIQKQFLIINTTYDKELTANTVNDHYRQKNPGTPITNRTRLKELFEQLNNISDRYNFIVCDVRFELPGVNAAEDSALAYFMNELQIKGKILFGLPGISNEENKAYTSIFPVIKLANTGSTNVTAVSGLFVRQQLTFEDGNVYSLPLRMYQRSDSTNVLHSPLPGLINYEQAGNTHLYYDTFIPEIYFDKAYFNRKYLEGEGVYDENTMIVDLGPSTRENGAYLNALLPASHKLNKIIFIGAIRGDHTDIHPTWYGDLDGSIILINTYLGLVQKQNKFNIWLWVVSFLFFAIISYKVILGQETELPEHASLWKIIYKQLKERFYYILLILLTLISSLVFNRSTNLIVLILLIEILHSLVRFSRRYRLERQQHP